MQKILEKLITPDDLSGNAKHILCETADCLQVGIIVHQVEAYCMCISFMVCSYSGKSSVSLVFRNACCKMYNGRSIGLPVFNSISYGLNYTNSFYIY
jgi:hypothetical protein